MRRPLPYILIATAFFFVAHSFLWAATAAYIPNFGGDNVHSVDVSNESDTTVNVCTAPYGAAVTPDGDDLVITCEGDDSVTVIPTDNFGDTAAHNNVSLGADHEPRGVAIETRGLGNRRDFLAKLLKLRIDETALGIGGHTGKRLGRESLHALKHVGDPPETAIGNLQHRGALGRVHRRLAQHRNVGQEPGADGKTGSVVGGLHDARARSQLRDG